VVAGLSAELRLGLGEFRLDVDLTVAPGEVVVLLGPNGAGKSTALRALAGLLRLDEGRIEVDGVVLADSGRGVHQPPYARPIGVVFQDYLLFPHLNVLDNVAFGPRAHGMGRSQARQHAARWLQRIGIADLAGGHTRLISGGQAQRVALARALATEPGLLLLDEPLAALDARTRLQVRGELRRHLSGFGGAALVVTHDPIDASVLADRLVVIEHGRVVQQGPPAPSRSSSPERCTWPSDLRRFPCFRSGRRALPATSGPARSSVWNRMVTGFGWRSAECRIRPAASWPRSPRRRSPISA
jgi:molybdate transport system ATP-binding protein